LFWIALAIWASVGALAQPTEASKTLSKTAATRYRESLDFITSLLLMYVRCK
jgi:hypothetical protein